MKLKKNDRVQLEDKVGTVLEDSWRLHQQGRYVSVWLDGADEKIVVEVDKLTKVK